MGPTNPKIKSEAGWQFQHFNKIEMVRRSNEAIKGNRVWKWWLGAGYAELAALLGGGGVLVQHARTRRARKN